MYPSSTYGANQGNTKKKVLIIVGCIFLLIVIVSIVGSFGGGPGILDRTKYSDFKTEEFSLKHPATFSGKRQASGAVFKSTDAKSTDSIEITKAIQKSTTVNIESLEKQIASSKSTTVSRATIDKKTALKVLTEGGNTDDYYIDGGKYIWQVTFFYSRDSTLSKYTSEIMKSFKLNEIAFD